jgi:GT2 family glycosyltransferase
MDGGLHGINTVTPTSQCSPARNRHMRWVIPGRDDVFDQNSVETVGEGASGARKAIRPAVRGKFLYLGAEKFWVRGVTYGAFRPDPDGEEYRDSRTIERDFTDIAANGFNAVRIPHTTPPRSLLDAAWRHGLRVMVGLSAEQYVGYLIDRGEAPDIEDLTREKVRRCAGHPALLCYALGNEIPSTLARWLGHRRVEQYLARLYRTVKAEDPGALITYVNYPTTEYLQLPFLDLVCFNIYLESQDRLEAYLSRLHNLAGNRPVVMSEIGLDSLRNGQEVQGRSLDWQIRTTFAVGGAGAFVFSWTDDWFRAGATVGDWAFGLTDRDRRPKPALAAVRDAFAEIPFPKDVPWPRISVVVCSYNGARTIRECFDALLLLEYPNFEVIVVDDGSTDGTAGIAREYGFLLISTENKGLSSARNTGLEVSRGHIVAYVDDDAYPDPHWLTYLTAAFLRTTHVGIGGPNIPPPRDGLIAECVANAPGGPAHVLLSDTEAEHLPGCNMAFRREALRAIGGFDPQFRVAGDDVDVCWRLRERGWTLGFSPAAVVWHHRRDSVRAYWRQQRGYGKAEALLEGKWPEKYNAAGHVTWAGRVYGNGIGALFGRRRRIYHGIWGAAPFQKSELSPPGTLASLLHMPELFLLLAVIALTGFLGGLWKPLLAAWPIASLGVTVLAAQAAMNASRARFSWRSGFDIVQVGRYGLTAGLHLLQPLARLHGRLGHGLTPWRCGAAQGLALPRPRVWAVWTPCWAEPEKRLLAVEAALRAAGVLTQRGGEYDRWDLEVRAGILGGARLLMAVEDHGAGTQHIRIRLWPRWSGAAACLIALFGALTAAARVDGAATAFAGLGAICGLVVARAVWECSASVAALLGALKSIRGQGQR